MSAKYVVESVVDAEDSPLVTLCAVYTFAGEEMVPCG